MNGKVFYGLHFAEGVCEYKEKGTKEEPYRVLIPESTCKNMDASFAGKPVFVDHVDDVTKEIIDKKCVGWVAESFFNKEDGKHWAKFIVTEDEGLKALADGYVLSNCYYSKGVPGPGGTWQGVDFVKEITEAEYEHLAIVRSPRYKQSVVLTPEEFKKYNADRELELEKLKNSLPEGENMLNLFKKEKVQNSDDLLKMSVVLPKSKKEIGIEKLINEMDEAEMNSSKPKMANADDKVKVGDGEMTIGELIEKYEDVCAKNVDYEEEKKKNSAGEDDEMKKKNAADKAEKEEEKKKNAEAKEKEEKEKAKNSEYEKLSNAQKEALKPENRILEVSSDKVARGQQRYGSK